MAACMRKSGALDYLFKHPTMLTYLRKCSVMDINQAAGGWWLVVHCQVLARRSRKRCPSHSLENAGET